MAKRKVTSKSTKKPSAKTRKGISNGMYASEHDFIIIIGGGLVVLMLGVFLFFLQ